MRRHVTAASHVRAERQAVQWSGGGGARSKPRHVTLPALTEAAGKATRPPGSSRCQRGGCRKPGRGFYSLNYLLTGLSPLRFGSQPGCLARRQTRNGLLCPQSVPVLYWTSGSRGSLLALATSPDLSFAAVTSCLSGLHVQSSMPPRSRQRCLIQLPPAKLSTPQRLILAGTLASETDFCRYVSIRD